MYTCPENDIHSVYLDGELPQNYVAEYESHVKSCPKCSAQLDEFRALKRIFEEDKNSFHFSQEYLDSSFERLQARLSYTRVTKAGKNSLKFPKLNGGIKYFAAGLAAAAVAFIIPGSGKSTVSDNAVSAFQPVARTSIASTANQVSADGNIDASVLNSMLASENENQSFYSLPVSSNVDSDVPVLMVGGLNYRNTHPKPSLASYDVFCPQEDEDFIIQEKNKGISFHVSAPFGEISLDIGK